MSQPPTIAVTLDGGLMSPEGTQDMKIQETGPRKLRSAKFLNLTYLVSFINSNLLVFPDDYLPFVAKLLYILTPPLAFSGQFLRAI